MDNKLTPDELAVRIAKGVLGAIPYVGGIVGELFDISINTNYEKKQKEWYEYVNSTLQDLVSKQIITREQIFEDSKFQALIIKSTRQYFECVEENKLPLIKSFLNASFTKNISLDKKYIFLRILSELTETHLLLLKEIHESVINKNPIFYFRDKSTEYLASKFAEGDYSYFELLQKGLTDFNLLNFNLSPKGKEAYLDTSSIGKEFLDFLLS